MTRYEDNQDEELSCVDHVPSEKSCDIINNAWDFSRNIVFILLIINTFSAFPTTVKETILKTMKLPGFALFGLKEFCW